MRASANISLNKSIQFTDLVEFSRDYCSDHLGRFFQNNYSPPALREDTFKIPAQFQTQEKNAFAICVMMNNHIVDLQYFSALFPDWNPAMERLLFESDSNSLHQLMEDPRLLSTIKSFKKLNDEIVIGRCVGQDFFPL
jgi:hypothetical protein